MLKAERLFYGPVCKHGHQNEQGFCLRYRCHAGSDKGSACMQCKPRYKGLTMEEIYNKVTSPHVPKRTPEEVAAMRVAASMRWNEKNKEKTLEYGRKYANSEKAKANAKKRYANQPEDIKKAKQEAAYAKVKERKQRELDAFIASLTPEELIEYQMTPRKFKSNKTNKNARARELYNSMTSEEKDEHLRYIRERRKKKQQLIERQNEFTGS